MANKLISMNKIRSILKQYAEGMGKQTISMRMQVSRNTVRRYVQLYTVLGLTMDDISSMSDKELDVLFSKTELPTTGQQERKKELYDFFPYVMKELRRTGVTRQLMWEEYIKLHPNGYKITQFQEYYNRWQHRVEPGMRIEHKVGDKMFVDYAGVKMHIINKDTGEISDVEVFVSVLGGSQLFYVEGVMSQCKEDFIMACEHALQYYGGAPSAIVSDNLKSAVIKSDKYEPTLNEAFDDFANHYGMTVLPAGAYKPKHKALVEGAVKIIYTRVYARYRNNEFYTLEELNNAIKEAFEENNKRLMQGRKYSRRDIFDELEKQELRPLPLLPYELKKKRVVTVLKDGHVCLAEDKHYYSVPYEHIGNKVTILYTQSQVEIFHKHERIAVHPRNRKPHVRSSIETHLASWQKVYTDWNPDKFINWGASIDQVVKQYIEELINRRKHPEHAYKSCMGILSLAKKVGNDRLINACRRGLYFGDFGYMTIKMIIEKNLDITFESDELLELPMPTHDNIRGEEYYQ